MIENRYFFDSLYGRITFPKYVWEVFHCTELQRLREVRLCNINSLCLTGSANINRYEHSIGTAYLALINTDANPWGMNNEIKRLIVLAGLLHDIGSGSFGHSLQYILSQDGFEHEGIENVISYKKRTNNDGFIYQNTKTEPLYFGLLRNLDMLLPKEDWNTIINLVKGKGEYGPLINGTMDLDNIDNVYRLSYHMGLRVDPSNPINLAKSIFIRGGKLIYNNPEKKYLRDWYQTRVNLYNYLLLNPDDFSAKCMLQEAIEIAREEKQFVNWNYVDYEMLQKMNNMSAEISQIVSRLMIGDLYGCLGIFSVNNIDSNKKFKIYKNRILLEKEIENYISRMYYSLKNPKIKIHIIQDINKTHRRIQIEDIYGKEIEIGKEVNRILVGIFLKNKIYNMDNIPSQWINEKHGYKLAEYIKEKFNDRTATEMELYEK